MFRFLLSVRAPRTPCWKKPYFLRFKPKRLRFISFCFLFCQRFLLYHRSGGRLLWTGIGFFSVFFCVGSLPDGKTVFLSFPPFLSRLFSFFGFVSLFLSVRFGCLLRRFAALQCLVSVHVRMWFVCFYQRFKFVLIYVFYHFVNSF